MSFLLSTVGLFAFLRIKNSTDYEILTYTVDTKTQDLKLYWKDDKGEILKSIQNLKNYVEGKNQTLIFAMNGGMFNKDFSPQGLFVQNENALSNLDTSNGNGNFYLKPNGVFYVTTNNIPFVCKTTDFKNTGNIKYATQSGPMLVIDGQIHAAFKKSSTNLNIRNGVGILPDNKVIFAMSKKEINFYNFAKYFQSLGCKNALYLDGFVSRTYLPEKNWMQTDGNFGVIIGVTKNKLH
ncbi:MAG: phosphodiester glycosidase family protein [Chitinophagaceae bacterium]|nr:phosphodiester glycosidase family protein [Chitinophagaceae bacterium]